MAEREGDLLMDVVARRRASHRPGGARWALALAVLCLSSTATAAQRSPQDRTPLPLEVMSYDDAVRVGAGGTGCTWKGGPKPERRLSMEDDRAGVRRAGGLVELKLAPGAKVMSLTYDSWAGDGIRIVVRDSNKVIRRGYEFSETIAWLDFTEDGRKRSFKGRLRCGSR